LIFASTSGEMLCGLGVCVMKHWMRERDQLIEQTLAFVEGVAAARPARAGPAAPARAEPAKAAQPARPAEPPKPVNLAPIVSERAEIERRVANFKAQQQKFQRAREADYDAIFSKTRSSRGNATRP
jgi:hypothetical protein